MKNEKKLHDLLIAQRSFDFRGLITALTFFLLLVASGCQKSDPTLTPSTTDQSDLRIANNATEVNLVSDVEEYDPLFIDHHLVNAWGMAFDDEGEIWVSAADKGFSTIYDANGNTLMPPVSIPFDGEPNGGAPTGMVYNPTKDFVISSNGESSEFIFATENGTIVAWNDGRAITVADRSANDANYKGLTLGINNGLNYLYATNFKQAKIDVFDASFNYVSNSGFNDPDIPAGFAPFNIKFIDGQLYVTYAKQLAPDNEDDEAGPGNGYVDIYNPDGSFVKRFASQGQLNSPWGIAQVSGSSGNILIGNFGSGLINTYDANGTFISHIRSNGQPLEIEGLWAIVYPGRNLPADQRDRLYFTAGPDDESHGIFGYIKPAQ